MCIDFGRAHSRGDLRYDDSSICFFFFKQKTAYEMRISDWSSDVCSSDLNHEANENRIIGEHSERDIPLDQVPRAAMNAARAQLASISKAEQVTRKEIGRASCRERVCQYV